MTIDYVHILSFDPIIYGRKQSNPTSSLVYGTAVFTQCKRGQLVASSMNDVIAGGQGNLNEFNNSSFYLTAL